MASLPVQSLHNAVPSWNGEAETLATYRFDVTMYIKGVKKVDRYVCGPCLVRALGPKTKAHAEAYPSLADVDEISDEGTCTGWTKLFEFVLARLNLTTVSDVGSLAVNFFTTLKRASGEEPADWINRFEKSERELLLACKTLDGSVGDVIAKPLRTWWLLYRSGLTPMEQGTLVGNADNSYDFDKVCKSFKTQYNKQAIAEHDRRLPSRSPVRTFSADDWHDELEQILDLADSEDDPEDDDPIEYEDAVLQAQVATRNFKDARDLLRKVRTTRGY